MYTQNSVRVVYFTSSERPDLLAQAWRLRFRMLVEYRKWDLCNFDGLEIDHYDKDAVHCVVIANDRVLGYVRGNPTNKPHMLRQCFPDLMDQLSVTESPYVWEISRFVVQPCRSSQAHLMGTLIDAGIGIGERVGARHLIAVVEGWMERAVRRRGYPAVRQGYPIVVGKGRKGPVRAHVSTVEMANVVTKPQHAA